MQRLPGSLEGATQVVGGNYLIMLMGPDSGEERWPKNVNMAKGIKGAWEMV